MSHPCKALDLDAWPRYEHYRFFREYDNPFFNICASVDVTRLVEACRAEGGPSFSIAAFYMSLHAANETEALRYRISGDDVLVFERIDGGSTILREDGTFGFGYFAFDDDFQRFHATTREAFEVARRASGALEDEADRLDLIHYSVIPWISFSSFSHARRWGDGDSIPRIVFGRYFDSEGRVLMPVSVEVHHALADGLHVGAFYDRLQSRLDDPGELG